jgi:cytoskeletal protein RodZ
MAAERVEGGLGAKLREARERRGLSLQQIASATKISVTVLQALERNDVARLPGGIFSRAFVRSYAAEVGLDPEGAIQELIGQSPQDAAASRRFAIEAVEDCRAVESDRQAASAVLRLVLISAPLAALVVYLGIVGARRPPKPSAGLPMAAEATDRPVATTVFAPDRPVATTAGLVGPSDGVSVSLAASGPCWVSVIADGKLALQREMQAGERHTVEIRRDSILTIGDAAAMTLTLNGTAARPLGRPGQVVTLRLNPSNFKEHLATP